MTGIKQVNCPTCQKIVRWSEDEAFRPFCSKQCQLIDFGEWASERYSVPAAEGKDFPDPTEDEIDDTH